MEWYMISYMIDLDLTNVNKYPLKESYRRKLINEIFFNKKET